jgi:tripeptidyl-peptidase-1
VAALGHNFWLPYSGQWTYLDGTSASTPLWAALLTYVNQDRVNKGQGLLGPANPWLYNVSAATQGRVFQKIVGGANNCTEATCCDTGFGSLGSTTWDAVTGLGPVRNLASVLDVV